MMNEQENQLDALLNTLLDEQPLAPLPPHFARRVLAQIYEPEPFRISLTDIFWSLCGAFFMSLIFLVGLDSTGAIALEWLPNISWQTTLSPVNEITPRLLLTLLVTCAELVFAAILYFFISETSKA